jgi:NADPH:quinone reductase-like Zn-dependent oxidoreductase
VLPALPWCAGSDGAGVIAEVGEGVTGEGLKVRGRLLIEGFIAIYRFISFHLFVSSRLSLSSIIP